MSVRPTNEGPTVPILNAGIGYDADANTDDIDPPPDRVPDGVVQTPLALPAVSIVQSGVFSNTNVDGSISVTLGATPTDGNTLIAVGTIYYAWDFVTPSGWTRIDTAVAWDGAFFGARATMLTRPATGASDTVTLTKTGSAYASLAVYEVAGIGDLVTSDAAENLAASTSIVAGPLTTTAGTALFLFAVAVQEQGTVSFTWPGGWTELRDDSPPAGPQSVTIGWSEVASSDGTEDVTITSTGSLISGWIMSAFVGSGVVWVLAPEVSDGDHATYKAVTASDGGVIARVALDQTYRLATSSLRIGYGTAGSTTIEIVGANAADFSDAVTLDSVTFTATGAYTSDTVAFALPNSTAYQYYRLEGDADCRIYTWELYEANDAAAAAEIASHLTDPTDAHDASAISVADTGGHFAGTDVEAVLAELATNSGPDVELVTVAATGATETVDVSVARTYDLTMDQDVTLTLSGAVTAEAWFVTLLIRQDGTGGWDVTWPGSVEWPTGGAPVIDPDPNVLTVVTLGTVDGGTVWLGFPTGGAGGAALTVEDEGTPLATAATTLDFVGAGVTASGSGTEKTVTIPGVTEASVRDVGHWEVVVSGTGPPVAVSTPDDDDWVYAWVPG